MKIERPIARWALVVSALCIGAGMGSGCKPAASPTASSRGLDGLVTFNRDIAPIFFQRCAPCHRPGQSAPFSLLSYAEAKKRAGDIVKVVNKRYMPPWLPEPGYGEFANERRLNADEMALIQRWVQEGALEGALEDLPPTPHWNEGWHLGKPDLVLQPSQPYTLGSEGKDVYRNFAIPVSVREKRYIQAVEFLPNNKSVHHARIMIDLSGQSRQLDEADPEPGFEGMRAPARFPPGHILTWAPGKVPVREPEGLPWVLEPDTDLVVQLHLQRTGKTESIQPRVGLYFTNQPPTQTAFLIGMVAMLIDMPAGTNDYALQRTFNLPVDVDALGVLPHLHYLGKEIQAYATLPSGAKKWLLLIKQWDFNWQGDYRFAQPVSLPKGSVVTMQYSYDNSAENVRNPNRPPRRVTYGPQSTDEMGELWIQVAPRNANDLGLLQQEQRLWGLREYAAYYENLLHAHPENAQAHFELGKTLGPLGRTREAQEQFEAALRLDPKLVEPHYYLGLVFLDNQRLSEARAEFEIALRLRPDFGRARDGLGLICLAEEKLDEAEAHFKEALRLNPNDPAARDNLGRIRQTRQQTKKEK